MYFPVIASLVFTQYTFKFPILSHFQWISSCNNHTLISYTFILCLNVSTRAVFTTDLVIILPFPSHITLFWTSGAQNRRSQNSSFFYG